MTLPFQVGDPVTGDLFVGRQEILEELITELKDLEIKQHFALISPRRTGKSSVLREIKIKFRNNPDVLVIYLDMGKVVPFDVFQFFRFSTENFLEDYAKKTKRTIFLPKAKEALKGSVSALTELIKSTHVKIGDLIEIWFKAKEKKEVGRLIENFLRQQEEIWNKKIIIIIDEFQRLQGFGEDFLWGLRSNIQDLKRTSFLVSGSKVSIMRYLTKDKKAPFYNIFISKELKRLDKKLVFEFVRKRLSLVGLKIDEEALRAVYSLTEGHPFYVQWLGRACFWEARRRGTNLIKEEDVKGAYLFALKEETGHLEEEFSKITGMKRDVIIAIAGGQRTTSGIARFLERGLNEISYVLGRLIEEGYIKKISRGKYSLTDSVFKSWIVKKIL